MGSLIELHSVSPWRRIGAYLLDYLIVIVPFLGLHGLIGWWLWSVVNTTIQRIDSPLINQGIVVVILTIPVVLYFSLMESCRWQATIGKRIVGVTVVNTKGDRAPFRTTLLRSVIKFLPWEFFHTLFWHWPGWPLNPAPPTGFQICAITVGWMAILWYVFSLFIGSRRTPYDRVTGTAVVGRHGEL